MPRSTIASLQPDQLAWPSDADAASDSLEANHYYMPDIRLARWEDVDRVFELEEEILPSLVTAADPQAEWEKKSDRIAGRSSDVADDLFVALDPGIASATLALGAIGCIPFWSCNGGAFGGDHASDRPEVKFFARPSHVSALKAAAKKAGATLEQDEQGRCVVSADAVRVMQAFARVIREALGAQS